MDVVALGELLIDFACLQTDADGYPTMAAHPGGAPANFLAALTKFGAETALLGKVGTDAFGVDRLSSGELEAHKILLKGGLVILENLCLKKVVGRTDFMLMALPLKYEHADGAPVRAVAQLGGDPFEKEMEQA